MNDSFPTLLFVVLVAAIAAVAIFGGDKQPPEPVVAPAAIHVEALSREIEKNDQARVELAREIERARQIEIDACDPLMVDPERDRALTAEQLRAKSIAYAKCLGVHVVDCHKTPGDPLCEGPPR